MNSRTKHTRLFGMRYNHPQLSNVLSSVYVCISNIAAACTAKVFAVSITNALTDIAGLAGIARVYGDKGNTGKLGLVLKERTKLKESPGVVLPSLSLSDSGSLPDASQVLNGNPFALAYSFLYNVLTDCVIGDSGESLFSAFKPFQKLPASLRAFALNTASHFEILVSNFVKRLGTERSSIGKSSDISNAEVHTNKVLNVLNIFFWYFNGLKKIKLALLRHKIGLAFDVRKILQVMADKRNLEPSINRPQGSRIPFIGKDAAVISDSSQWLEVALSFLIKVIGIGNLADTADNHLSGQPGTFFKFVVSQVMQLKLIKNSLLPRNIRNLVANVIRGFHRIEQRLGLFSIRQQLYLQSELHAFSIAQILEKVKRKGDNLLLSIAKARGIRRLVNR